jgi:hypothetical protein
VSELTRRGFLGGLGAILLLEPPEPRRVYSFFSMSDDAYVAQLVREGAMVPQGRYLLTRPVDVGPGQTLRAFGAYFQLTFPGPVAKVRRHGRLWMMQNYVQGPCVYSSIEALKST